MNLFVANPEWGWWIILYFFLGGMAAGAYFVATLIDLAGRPADRDLARLGYLLAFPLVLLCGLFLTVDLNRPERFWHMLLKSEVVHDALAQGWPRTGASWQTMGHALAFKYWSPMSIGAWALLLFGVCSFFSLLGSIWSEGRLARVLRYGFLGRLLQIIGCLVGFFIASYTGALISATNQPLWADTTWIAPLFLASAASTGMAAMHLLGHWRGRLSEDSLARLYRADFFAIAIEAVVFVLFLASLGGIVLVLLRTVHGLVLLIGTGLLGLAIPLVLHARHASGSSNRAALMAVCVLAGGFFLRYGLLNTAEELLARPGSEPAAASFSALAGASVPLVRGFSPEDGRSQGGGPGADLGNKPADFEPRSKVFHEP